MEQTPVMDEQDGLSVYDRVTAAMKDGKTQEAKLLLESQHPADQADMLESMPSDLRAEFINELKKGDFDPAVLAYLDEHVQEEILDNFSLEELTRTLPFLESDDAVELLENLNEAQAKQVLANIPAKQRLLLEEALTFPEDSAGRLMQRELVAVPVHWTVGQTLDYIRVNRNLPTDFPQIFIVDPRYRPVGQIALSKLLQSSRRIPVRQLMEELLHSIPATLPERDAAFLFQQYELLTAPVVTENGRLLGRITIDDVIEVIDEAAEADIMHLGGVVAGGDLYRNVLTTTRNRFTWLFLNLLTAILASMVIGLFQNSIEKMVALAVLMPIVASMGGNAGTQTLTVVVRSLATRELSANNALRTLGKEIMVGSLNGILFAIIGGLTAWVWFDQPQIALALGLAMISNLLTAGLFGFCIPIALSRLRIDPAIASGVFLTTMTDVVGFFSFLGIAVWLIL